MTRIIFSVLFAVMFLSCAKPTDPESLTPGSGGYAVVATVPVSGYAQAVKVRDTIAYVAQGEGGLTILSVANPRQPRILSVCQQGVRGYAHKLALKDSTVYIAAGGFGLNTIDVSNPYRPAFAQNYGGASNTYDVEVFGGWLLEAKGEWGVRFDGLPAPSYADLRGRIQGPGYAQGMAFTSDSTLLLTCGEMGLAIYDLRDLGWYGGEGGGWYDERKEFSAWIDLPGYSVDVATKGNQRIAFVACGTRGVYVVDYADSGNARVIGSYSTGGYAKEVAYQNNRLYVTTELRGLQILAVENPAAPRLVGVVDTEHALSVAVGQRHVYVADEIEGLIVIAIPPY